MSYSYVYFGGYRPVSKLQTMQMLMKPSGTLLFVKEPILVYDIQRVYVVIITKPENSH